VKESNDWRTNLELIRRAQAGDMQAFASLFEQYKNLVYKTAYLVLDERGEAEDALQEVFLLVHKSLSSFDPQKGAFTTWLYRITMNYCLNHRHKRRHSSLEDVSPTPALDFPSSQLADEDAVWQATRSLSDKLQAVVILRYYWDLPYAEIAQVLDVPLGTVKSRLDLALKSLRKIIEEQDTHELAVPQTEVCK
jgi:RNA polymerase sigma-70 factor, ECF subfamily